MEGSIYPPTMSVKRSVIHDMDPSDVYEYVGNLGLGFGIDATDPKPWEQKRAYQVCRIQEKSDKIVSVDEGGNWHIYQHTVESQHEIQGKLTSSIGIPNCPVSIGAGAEVSRKSTRSCVMYGRRLIDCKVSICQDSYRLSSAGDSNDFEARLSSWIVDRIHYHASVAKLLQQKLGRNSVDEILPFLEKKDNDKHVAELGLEDFKLRLAVEAAKYLAKRDQQQFQDAQLASIQNAAKYMAKREQQQSQDVQLASIQKTRKGKKRKTSVKWDADQIAIKQQRFELTADEQETWNAMEWKFLVDLCREFVRFFNITHFVSAVELGAAEYQVTEEITEEKDKGASSSLNIFQKIQFSAHASDKWKDFTQSKDTRKLGVIKDDGDEVERLAVLGVNVLPITERVRTPYLRFAMQRALNEHIDEYYEDIDHQFKKGPFKIVIKVADSPNHYLSVYWDDAFEKLCRGSQADLDDDYKPPTNVKMGDQTLQRKKKHRSLKATDKEVEAARFFLIPVDGEEENEFYIVYYHEDLPTKGRRFVPPHSRKTIPYYLQAKKDNLRFVPNPGMNCQFRFTRSVRYMSGSSLLKDAEDEPIYIKCPKALTTTNYVYMFKQDKTAMGYAGSKDTHNGKTLFFLFNLCLARPTSPAYPATPSEPTEEPTNNSTTDQEGSRYNPSLEIAQTVAAKDKIHAENPTSCQPRGRTEPSLKTVQTVAAGDEQLTETHNISQTRHALESIDKSRTNAAEIGEMSKRTETLASAKPRNSFDPCLENAPKVSTEDVQPRSTLDDDHSFNVKGSDAAPFIPRRIIQQGEKKASYTKKERISFPFIEISRTIAPEENMHTETPTSLHRRHNSDP